MPDCPHLFHIKVVSIICFFVFFAANTVSAQQPADIFSDTNTCTWEEFTEEYFASDISEKENAFSREERLESLANIYREKININDATSEDLLQLPFLSQAQADSIVSFIGRYGALSSLGELMLIPRLDYRTRRFLTVFLTCKSSATQRISVRDMLLGGKNELSANISTPFYTPEGYKNGNNLPTASKYLGDKNRFTLRYRHDYGDELRYGVTADKDAGEPLACRGNAFVDSYSAYVYRHQKNGRYAFAVGDYRIRFAEGLVAGNGFFYGKKAALYDFYNNRKTITPHTSSSENDFLRGAAGTLRIGRISATAFVSYVKCDAVLNDSGDVTSFLRTGYHRTATEQKRRANTAVFATGADVTMELKRWEVGLSTAVAHYNRDIQPRTADYNRYTMRGRNFRAASVHYAYNGMNLTSHGEAALSESGATAFINTVRWRILPYVAFTNILRSYSKKYAEPFAASFQSASRAQNEYGVYTGVSADVTNNLILRGYVDVFRYPHASYTYRAPLKGIDYSAEVYWHDYDDNHIALEWRCSHKKCDNGFAVADTMPVNRNLLKLSGRKNVGRFVFNTALSGTVVSKRGDTSRGWMLNQRIAYKQRTWQVSGSLSYFDTDDYAARLYAYESNVAYMYNLFSAMYGNGIRFALLGRIKLLRNLEIACKYAATKYFDRNSRGMGAQKISKSYIGDLVACIRVLF